MNANINTPVDQSQSSTFVIVEQNQFNISYVDGTGSSGDYFEDTFTIGGGTIKNFEMGLALDTSIGVGIMGIGYNISEANVDTGNGTIYPNLPFAMADAGLINANAYSLWLNDLGMYNSKVDTDNANRCRCNNWLHPLRRHRHEEVYRRPHRRRSLPHRRPPSNFLYCSIHLPLCNLLVWL